MDVLPERIKKLISTPEGKRALDRLRREAEHEEDPAHPSAPAIIHDEHGRKFVIRPVKPA